MPAKARGPGTDLREIDTFDARNVARLSLINRVLGKPAPIEKEDGEPVAAGSAREVFSLQLSRRYSLEETEPLELGPEQESQWGPWEATLRSYPGDRLGFRLDVDYSDLFSRLTSLRLTGNLAFPGGNAVDFSWSPRYQAVTGETLDNHGSLGWRWNLLDRRLAWASALSYDFERQFLRDQRHFLTWRGSCYTIRLELHESRTVFQRRRDYLLSVDLKNVGTFLDLTGGGLD